MWVVTLVGERVLQKQTSTSTECEFLPRTSQRISISVKDVHERLQQNPALTSLRRDVVPRALQKISISAKDVREAVRCHS